MSKSKILLILNFYKKIFSLFHCLISNEKFTDPEKPLKQKFNLKKKNSLLKFEYTISNHNPMIFDIFETNYFLTTELDKEIKLKMISVIYNNQDRNKVNK